MHADFSLGISQGKPYALEGENGRSFVTDQYVKLAHGKAVRDFPFVTFSNSPLTEVCFFFPSQVSNLASQLTDN